MPDPERTSLLGLPAELRLKIYHYAIHSDMKCTILDDIEHDADPRVGVNAILVPNAQSRLSLQIPWMVLQRTCKSIYLELGDMTTNATYQNDRRNWTYSLDLDVRSDTGQSTVKYTRQVIWRSMPCPPARAEVLVINVNTRSGAGPWTEGGPSSLARAVYQIINHLTHNGPRLVTKKPILHPLSLRKVIIHVDKGSRLDRPPPIGCNTEPEFNYSWFTSGLEQVARTGDLLGTIQTLKLYDEEGDKNEIEVKHVVQARYPQWRQFGFYWGV